MRIFFVSGAFPLFFAAFSPSERGKGKRRARCKGQGARGYASRLTLWSNPILVLIFLLQKCRNAEKVPLSFVPCTFSAFLHFCNSPGRACPPYIYKYSNLGIYIYIIIADGHIFLLQICRNADFSVQFASSAAQQGRAVNR